MPRTTATAVSKLLDDVFVPCDFDYTPFIETANALVTEVCTVSGYATSILELIERWLAAHFSFIRIGQISREQVGRASQEYATKIGFNLAQTKYGQQALVLDYKGNLARVSALTDPTRSRIYQIIWGGTTCEEDRRIFGAGEECC